MNIIDSSGWVEILANTNRATLYKPAVESGKILVPSIVVFEVCKYLRLRLGNVPSETVGAFLQQYPIIDLTGSIAEEAADFSVAHKVPMADSIIYVTAKKYKATLWTQDVDLKDLPGVKFFPKL